MRYHFTICHSERKLFRGKYTAFIENRIYPNEKYFTIWGFFGSIHWTTLVGNEPFKTILMQPRHSVTALFSVTTLSESTFSDVQVKIHRLNLERLNLERPNLERLNLEWTEHRMDWTPTGPNPEWDSTPNGLNPEWDWTPNGPNPEWNWTPNGT